MSRDWKIVAGRGTDTISVADLDLSAVVVVHGRSGTARARVTATIRSKVNRAYAKAEAMRLVAGLYDVIGDYAMEAARDPREDAHVPEFKESLTSGSAQDNNAVIVDVAGPDSHWVTCSHFGNELMEEVV